MIHRASAKFWKLREALPENVQKQADKAYQLLKNDPRHPSLHFKKLAGSRYWSVRINDDYRALAVESDGGMAWFWIGSHAEYDRLIR